MKTKHCLLLMCIPIFLFSCERKEKKEDIKNRFPSYDQDFLPPYNTKEIFELSQNYPDTFEANEKYPWIGIDFKVDYERYLKTVLDYCLDGNIETDFKIKNNSKRKWYHAPWLHYGKNGREYHHGLTRERRVPVKELADTQNEPLENWAIGFYNAPGGYTIGKVWNSDTIPMVSLANFPEGTVSFKLLFTTATEKEVPFLKGTMGWQANIYKYCNPDSRDECESKSCLIRRYDDTVRLLQIDIAVKDKNAGPTGWVFGTFIYDGSKTGKSIWDRMVPVGVMWGDDDCVKTLITQKGAFKNTLLKETVLNEYLINKNPSENQAFMKHFGLGGRLNGPVDNPISSCISCHGKAANMDNGSPAPMADFNQKIESFQVDTFYKYFATIKGGKGKLDFGGQTYNKLDYSLQLSAGIRNFYQEKIDRYNRSLCKPNPCNLNTKGFINVDTKQEPIQDLPEVSRGGCKNP